MKITGVQAITAAPRWVFVKTETNDGVVGWGEALGDKTGAVVAAIEELKPILIGQDPQRIEQLWQLMYRGAFWRGGPILNAAISGVEISLWDILGQRLGVPVYQLMGGAVRDKVRFYCHIGSPDGTVKGLVASAERARERGFTAVKFGIVEQLPLMAGAAEVKKAVGLVRGFREAMGDDLDFMVDLHGRVSPAMAKILCQELAPYYPLFLEEPVLPENVEALADVARHTTAPIATGERLFTRFGFREVLEKHAAAVLQPDLCICGGIAEGRKIAAMAEAYFVAVAPHNPYGPITTAASLQLDACTPNFLIQEFVSLGEELFEEPFVMKDGYVDVPKRPGLGIRVDEKKLAARAYGGHTVPTWYHKDGSLADW
ncbi:MAG TPA: galactonate dehydratase [Armatimonadota bacterium]|jgi:galactonate dehydratase